MKHGKTGVLGDAPELLVVFIGVTSAFLLNTCRKNLQLRKLEAKFIENFFTNLVSGWHLLLEQNRKNYEALLDQCRGLRRSLEDLYRKVRENAERNQCSVNGEIISILTAATASRRMPVDELLARARLLRAKARPIDRGRS
jgi:hypothetical protein